MRRTLKIATFQKAFNPVFQSVFISSLSVFYIFDTTSIFLIRWKCCWVELYSRLLIRNLIKQKCLSLVELIPNTNICLYDNCACIYDFSFNIIYYIPLKHLHITSSIRNVHKRTRILHQLFLTFETPTDLFRCLLSIFS